ncbi:murein transglycosylase A [Aquisalinus flavus]|uniref:peptidoglycan lytic exotransglycosylase n=1 Tax=Aquisalinus flavus TaxID=1526572 RepID=A0A8J2Y5L5_9PROT|nr:MltA domain-containing protein [Aquisalinus flavus]MBD0425607.1 murein transglycosylase A [Aquisalinus flavus]UNE48774.1 murein transglycosylase [Aquisalinus flavus]GGD14711.1 membrane-bound lytic murein transglycosylase A [Aquisalinus flavus]
MHLQTRIWQAVAALAILAFVVLLLIKMPLGTDDKDSVARAVNLPPLGYEVVSFAALPGWAVDDHREALEPFLRSCIALQARPAGASANPVEYVAEDQPVSFGGTKADWQPSCEAALALVQRGNVTLDEARAFFEQYFAPVHFTQPVVEADADPVMTGDGLFTGYFEPIFPASATPTDEYSAPVLTRPGDLVTIDLGAFRSDLAGTRLAGRVQSGELVPYDTHAQIMSDRPDTGILAWMNPNDLLFLQIQGSGRLSIDGRDVHVGYDAPNGHPYTAIGRELVRIGALTLEEVSMQSIYEWLETAPPETAAQVRQVNESYIFFRMVTEDKDPALGPFGAQGIQLTAMRSLAVDRRYHTLGAPVWVDLDTDDNHPFPMRRLFIAQDTGGAIRGPVRGDLFIGSGREAGGEAGLMRRTGRLYALLPLSIIERLEADGTQAQADA